MDKLEKEIQLRTAEAKKYVGNILHQLVKGKNVDFNFWCREYKDELDKNAEMIFSLPGVTYYIFSKWLYIVGNECLICVGKVEMKADGIYLCNKEDKLLATIKFKKHGAVNLVK